MSKFFPFMNTIETVYTEKQIPCNDNCGLFVKGYCSLSVLAQKAINDYEKSKKSAK